MRYVYALPVAAGLLLLAFSSSAQLHAYSWYTGDRQTECRGANAAPQLSSLDRDRDGFISDREYEDYGTSAEHVSLFRSIDTNSDGRLSGKELQRYREIGDCM